MVRRIHGHLRTTEGNTHKHTHTHSDKTGLKKGTWTPEEDRKLVAHVTTYGCWSWRQLPKYAGLKRCGKSCRLRWMNYLRPNIKRGNYSKEEDDIILKLHESLGNRWSAIAAHLPGRNDNEIKNHWHTSLKKRSEPNSISHEPKLSSMDFPKYGSIQEKKSDPNNSHPILESTPLSPQHSSSTTNKKCTNFLGEDDVEIFAEASGNFWTEPFLSDNYGTGNDHFLAPLMHSGPLTPPSPVIAHLPGRNDNEIKNHWHTSLKKRSEPNSISHEPKLSSMDFPKYGSIQEKKSNPNNSHPILESTPLSPQHSSSTTNTKCTNFLGEDDVEIFAEATGNFWTDSFLSDNYDTGNDHFLAPLMHSGPLTPPSPVIGEEFLFFHGLYDETY